ncbi:hypothetical protein, partial [Luteimonas sp. SDU101]|uniref:hypothetical protein n=1 Tax=Luteimonas sp. SDU101 TaxID=3422593 RepID=UPI003EB847F2
RPRPASASQAQRMARSGVGMGDLAIDALLETADERAAGGAREQAIAAGAARPLPLLQATTARGYGPAIARRYTRPSKCCATATRRCGSLDPAARCPGRDA